MVLDTIKQQQKQTYRLRNVRAGYVVYRALVIMEFMLSSKGTLNHNLLISIVQWSHPSSVFGIYITIAVD